MKAFEKTGEILYYYRSLVLIYVGVSIAIVSYCVYILVNSIYIVFTVSDYAEVNTLIKQLVVVIVFLPILVYIIYLVSLFITAFAFHTRRKLSKRAFVLNSVIYIVSKIIMINFWVMAVIVTVVRDDYFSHHSMRRYSWSGPYFVSADWLYSLYITVLLAGSAFSLINGIFYYFINTYDIKLLAIRVIHYVSAVLMYSTPIGIILYFLLDTVPGKYPQYLGVVRFRLLVMANALLLCLYLGVRVIIAKSLLKSEPQPASTVLAESDQIVIQPTETPGTAGILKTVGSISEDSGLMQHDAEV